MSTIKTSKASKYKCIADQIIESIKSAQILPNERLPSVRDLMASEKISRTTAFKALQELERLGFASVEARKGFFVHYAPTPIKRPAPSLTRPPSTHQGIKVAVNHLIVDLLHQSSQKEVFSLGSAVLSAELIPTPHLNRVLSSVVKDKKSLYANYTSPPGLFELRSSIARLMKYRGVACHADDIIITAGDNQFIQLILQTITVPGECVAIESPTYFGILQAIENAGLRALEIKTDPVTGIDLEELSNKIATNNVRCVVLNPTLLNPLGSTMPLTHRERLMDLLSRYQIPLIEDDVFFDLYLNSQDNFIKPIKAYDTTGLVLYCSSFSKVLAPGFRIGWCLAGSYHRDILYNILVNNYSCSSLSQVVLAEFMRRGYYEPQIQKLRSLFATQQVKINQLISQYYPQGTQLSNPNGGYIYWIKLPFAIDQHQFYKAALTNNIAITPGTIFFASAISTRHFRLCIGGYLTPAVEKAIIDLGSLCLQFQKNKNPYSLQL